MANSRIKDLSERTTLASGDYLATDNNSGTRKVDASKILTPISNAQATADNVATKVSNGGDAFSPSKGYSVGELCIYDNKVYRCKTSYSTGASWSSRSSYFDQVTLTDAVSDLNNALSDVQSGIDKIKSRGNNSEIYAISPSSSQFTILSNGTDLKYARGSDNKYYLVFRVDGVVHGVIPMDTQIVRGGIGVYMNNV